MLDESFSPTLGSQTESLNVGRVIPHKRNSIGRIRTVLKFLGPAFIVSVAYIDPGNFATNISGGSKFNYNLLWVILWSNLMAIFLQSLSAKLGIATGYNLPQMCGKVFSRRVNWFFWIVAELAAIATNLAEFLGCTLGLYLLFRIPMAFAGLITAVLTFFIVYMGRYGQRFLEGIISILVAVICISYTMELFLAKPDWASAGLHVLMPSLPNGEAVMIAVGMLGATVMPHVIFLHSQLVQQRNKDLTEAQKKKHFKLERLDITIAMNIAFVINAAMVVVSAAVFYRNGMVVNTIEQAHQSLSPLLGAASSGAFGLALVASGLSSSVVGTMAGTTIMQGFVGLKINDNVTRIVTMLPAMLIIILGINPMQALVLSQVVLSFILPVAIIPMLLITKRKDLMGSLVNKPATNVVGWIVTSIILVANAVLVVLTFSGGV
ncbi:Mn2+/Fe2+ transporter, NRAMP family [Ruminiclostridium papyrosolvens DSM 2782]|uniref:Divalent metal cation transporter MntH n=1 Tax=Ruminiclostridium papyrosolvens DSM 2782 TaxID=588581 RepID=F1TFQ5_9FIRM|nr:Nramp family divalent metal transporter [Ruminiclostridium papyrosolvens]EGD46787.1 Mn2+/Fe2+ transporter, NRAMP family [Ruminiclostridium papyrosolvens DSM 2782]WES34874.1 Nramp family divalent metal transporter [Ruminiclostridium papyrosolvens DSM 2782]